MTDRRCHVYATAEEARDAIEAIDAARGPVERAVTILGRRSTEQAIAGGLVRRSRRGTLSITKAGVIEGYAIDAAGRVVRHHEIPTRTWASVRHEWADGDRMRLVSGIELEDGTFAVPVCERVAGVEVEVRGEVKRIPDDTTARTVTRIDVARERVIQK